MQQWFDKCETIVIPFTPDELRMLYTTENTDPKDLEARSRELMGILSMLTDGDAKVMIRGETDGLTAYQLLHQTYSRTTLAKTVRTIREALVPKKANFLGEVVMKISEWENRVTALEKLDPLYKLQPMMKVALLTEMCPEEIRDLIFQNMDTNGSTTDYRNIRDKVISWV